jgi:cytosine/adenosine deaminase-related metal-dependent hydrolase
VTAPSFEDGAVLVDDSGRVAAVGSHEQVPAPRGVQSFEFPDADLMPGLVNCHTHLELTQLGGGVQHDGPEFLTWIRRIRELKDATSAEAFYEAAVAGIRDCWARGVTCIAETGSSGAVMRALHHLGGRGIVYQEVFGPDPAKVEISMSELFAALQPLRRLGTSQLRLGISPHAPYTVSAPLYDAVAAYARLEDLPIAVHVAESPDEVRLVRDGTGAFAEALRARGIALEPARCSPVAFLIRRGVIGRGTLCIHAVQVDAADVELLRSVRATVAHCPRSNAAHRHGRMPLELFQQARVPVGLGTDSVVSVGDLDLWAEAEAAGLRGDAALKALTIEGARALGWDKEIGSLEPGKAGDVVVFASSALVRPRPPSTTLLTVVSGRIVHHISGQ